MPLGSRLPSGTVAFAPDEDAGVAARLHVAPLDVQDEILVLLLRPHHADRRPVHTSTPSRTVHVSLRLFTLTQPKVLSVEQVLELRRLAGSRRREPPRQDGHAARERDALSDHDHPPLRSRFERRRRMARHALVGILGCRAPAARPLALERGCWAT